MEKLTPQQKHKAYLILGVTENVVLQKMIDKYGIRIKKNPSGGMVKAGYLAGFNASLALAKLNEEWLDMTFGAIVNARWNLNNKGFQADVIRSIGSILKLHNGDARVISAVTKYMKGIEPDKFFSEAKVKYPERTALEALVLVLEDYAVEYAKVERVYFGGKVA